MASEGGGEEARACGEAGTALADAQRVILAPRRANIAASILRMLRPTVNVNVKLDPTGHRYTTGHNIRNAGGCPRDGCREAPRDGRDPPPETDDFRR